jgi:hypothetical protein
MTNYVTSYLDPNRERWYRYEIVRYSNGVDEYDNPLPGYSVAVEVRDFMVSRHTPKGVWIKTWAENERFVLKDARKRYACPTKEEALDSFIARQRRRISILETQAKDSKTGMRIAEGLAARLFEQTSPSLELSQLATAKTARELQLEQALADATSGLRYIEQSHGRLYGVGWDRVYETAARLLGSSSNHHLSASHDTTN